MKNLRIYLLKISLILIFFLLLTIIFKISLPNIFSLQEILFLFFGIFIFSIVSLLSDCKEKKCIKWIPILALNTIKSGLLMSVILIINTVSNPLKYARIDFSPIDLVLILLKNCRPLFYSLIIRIVILPQSNIVETKIKENNAHILNSSILTKREQEIARLAEKGLTNSEIADTLFISVSTVKRHIANIFQKVNISSRNELKEINQLKKLY